MQPYVFRSRLRVALGVLVALTFASALGALVTMIACHEGRAQSRRFASAARNAAQLGQLAREQYIHEAHTLIAGDRSHVAHHDQWVDRFQREIVSFRPFLEPNEQAELDAIAVDSHEVAHLFSEQIVPALEHGDAVAARAAHDAANARVDRMTRAADSIGAALLARSVAADDQAERRSWWSLALVGATCSLALAFGVLVARRLWNEFTRPLEQLEAVAHRVTSGDRAARMGAPQLVELAPLAAAFDTMLDTLADKEQQLRATDRLAAVGRVAAGVAHEMNNPLGVIRGYLKTLRRQKHDERTATDLATIDAEAAICQHIVEDLLAHTRVPVLSRSEVDAGALVAGAAARALDSQSPDDVTVRVEPALLHVDPLRLRQVLVNLVRNALEAAPGERVEVIGERRGGDGYAFRVRDHGPGLTSEARARLFEPFFTTRPGGTGLGLAISYGLVAAHAGNLIAADRTDGAELIVELPGCVRQGQAAT